MYVTPEDHAILHEACDALDSAGIAYVIGGGTAVTIFGRNRRTKDFDIFLNRAVVRAALTTLARVGFCTSDTDKNWLYKAFRDETLVDLVVEVRGGIEIDSDCMSHARMVEQHGHYFRIMGPEDTLYRKALTLTEGRPDWYDGISIIERQGDALDWPYFTRLALRRYPRRVLAFLYYTQTELHVPPGAIHSSQSNPLFPGDTPGLVPEWVVSQLMQRIMLGDKAFTDDIRRLEHYPKAA